MYVPLPPLDSRLQDRYVRLVKSHSGVSPALASGVRAVAEASSAFACTRAASRFFHNEHVSLSALAAPLIAFAQEEVPRTCDRYALGHS